MAIVFGIAAVALAVYIAYQHMKHQTAILDLRRITGAEQTRLNDLLTSSSTEFVNLKTQTDLALEAKEATIKDKDSIITAEIVKRQRFEDQVAQLTKGMKPSLWRYKKGKQSVYKYTEVEADTAEAKDVTAYMVVPEAQQSLDLETSDVSTQ